MAPVDLSGTAESWSTLIGQGLILVYVAVGYAVMSVSAFTFLWLEFMKSKFTPRVHPVTRIISLGTVVVGGCVALWTIVVMASYLKPLAELSNLGIPLLLLVMAILSYIGSRLFRSYKKYLRASSK